MKWKVNLRRMRKLLWLVLCSFCLFALEARAQIEWRVSVKFILDANGHRPTGGKIDTDQDVRDQVDAANRLIDPFGRGYRFALTEIVNLSGYSAYFNADRETASSNLQVIASSNPGSVLWRPRAINFYINNAPGANDGISSPTLIVLGHNVTREAFTHESGHYLGLCHTHGCPCATCDSTNCPVPPVSDNIADTLPDNTCWDQDDISSYAYNGKLFINLNAAQQAAVSNTFNNIMCYHFNRKVFTSDQLDELADTSNGSRNNLTTGFTRFVDLANGCLFPNGSSDCGLFSGGPYPKVADGISSASPGDIVLIRRGHYNEPMTITKATTLRATRGDALIGKP